MVDFMLANGYQILLDSPKFPHPEYMVMMYSMNEWMSVERERVLMTKGVDERGKEREGEWVHTGFEVLLNY